MDTEWNKRDSQNLLNKQVMLQRAQACIDKFAAHRHRTTSVVHKSQMSETAIGDDPCQGFINIQIKSSVLVVKENIVRIPVSILVSGVGLAT